LSVTKIDIKNGIPHNSFSCPVALAFYRELPGFCVEVNGGGIDVYNNVMDCRNPVVLPLKRYKSTKKMIKFIRGFDRNITSRMKPIKLRLRVKP